MLGSLQPYNGVKQDPSWRNSRDAQWAAIQRHSLTLAPIASAGGGRAALWQHDSTKGRYCTKCLDLFDKRQQIRIAVSLKDYRESERPLWRPPLQPAIIISCLNLSGLDLYSIYPNMRTVALAAPRCIRLWVEDQFLTCQDAHNRPGLNKIPWQGNEHVYWLEMNEPTDDNILSEIDSVLARGYRYRLLIGPHQKVDICYLQSQTNHCGSLK